MNNNFFEICNSIFSQNSHLQELKEDVNDYDTAEYYLNNFNYVRRQDIEKFIVDVRKKNLITKTRELLYNATSNNQNVKFLWQLDLAELYSTLKAEQVDIVYKGVLDAIKFLNELNEEQLKKSLNGLSMAMSAFSVHIERSYKKIPCLTYCRRSGRECLNF